MSRARMSPYDTHDTLCVSEYEAGETLVSRECDRQRALLALLLQVRMSYISSRLLRPVSYFDPAMVEGPRVSASRWSSRRLELSQRFQSSFVKYFMLLLHNN